MRDWGKVTLVVTADRRVMFLQDKYWLLSSPEILQPILSNPLCLCSILTAHSSSDETTENFFSKNNISVSILLSSLKVMVF